MKTDTGLTDSKYKNEAPASGELKKRPQNESIRTATQGAAKRRHVSDTRAASQLQEASTTVPIAPRPIRLGRPSDLLMDNINCTTMPSRTVSFEDRVEDHAHVRDEDDANSTIVGLDITSPQSLSLPSPSASPINGSSHLHDPESTHRSVCTVAKSTNKKRDAVHLDNILKDHHQAASMMEIPKILETFDDLPQNIQSYLMYHLLKRSNKTTLQVVAGIVNPALKRDFLDLLPYELSLHVLSYLDSRSLTRAAQVSKRWEQIVDDDEYTWKNRIERDQYSVEDGEFDQAIEELWGCGGTVRTRRLSSYRPEYTADRDSVPSSAPHIEKNDFEEMVNGGLKQPLVGQHIYKAIYKRHHIQYNTWMNPKKSPKHLSFESHGRYVVTCLQLDNDKIITGSEDANINIFDVNTGELRMSLEGHEGGVWALQYLGNTLVSGSTDRTVRVWDMTTGQCTQVFEGHTSTVRCLQILPQRNPLDPEDNPHIIVTGSRDSTLRIWKLPRADDQSFPTIRSPESSASEEYNPFFIRALTGHTQSVRAIAADEDTLISGSYDFSVRVWRISTGKCVWKLNGHSQKVYSVVLDTKQKRCISGSMDWKVKIWDLLNGNCLYTLEGHSNLVGLLSLSHDRLVSAAADYTLRVWDPTTGQCKQTLTAHTGAITCFQHDGDKVISGSDGTVKLWDLKTGKFSRDLLTGLTCVWQVRFDDRRCVAAVQKDNMTFIEVLDFGRDREPSQTQEGPSGVSRMALSV